MNDERTAELLEIIASCVSDFQLSAPVSAELLRVTAQLVREHPPDPDTFRTQFMTRMRAVMSKNSKSWSAMTCPGCGAIHPAETARRPCCNPECGGHWGTGCYHCHHPDMSGPMGTSRPAHEKAKP